MLARSVNRWLAWSSSAVLHGAVLAYLAGQSPTPRSPRPILTTLVELPQRVELAPPPPPSVPEPEPEHRAPDPPPRAEPRPVAQPPSPSKVTEPKAPTTPAVPEGPAPAVRLSGVRLSNVSGPGVSVAVGPGHATRSSAGPEPSPAAAPQLARTRMVPVNELLRKPAPPSLDSALRRHYPPELKRRGIEGQALVRVRVTARGTVSQVRLISESRAGFGSACGEMLRNSHWQPGIDRRGTSVDTELSYRCRFQVDF